MDLQFDGREKEKATEIVEKNDESKKRKQKKNKTRGILTYIFILGVVLIIIYLSCLCDVKGCSAFKVGGGGEYCVAHTCFEEGCFNLKLEGSKYCELHNCAVQGCTNRKEKGAYCLKHVCAFPTCKAKGIGEAQDGINLCKKHFNCCYEGCDREREAKKYYCSRHNCRHEDCLEPVVDGKKLCQEHQQEYETKQRRKDKLTIDIPGKRIYRICMKDSIFSIQGKYRGDGYFGIQIKDSNQNFVDLLCNEIGSYNINKSVYLREGEYYYIEIEWTSGSWSLGWYGTYGD